MFSCRSSILFPPSCFMSWLPVLCCDPSPLVPGSCMPLPLLVWVHLVPDCLPHLCLITPHQSCIYIPLCRVSPLVCCSSQLLTARVLLELNFACFRHLAFWPHVRWKPCLTASECTNLRCLFLPEWSSVASGHRGLQRQIGKSNLSK